MSEVVNLIKASTIVVVRPDPNGGIEVLMTRRCPEMQFLGGFLVFPGGGVENEDCSEKMLSLCRGLTRSDAQKILGADLAPEVSLGHWVAAVRELFEETGIHFFIDENGMAPDGSTGHLAERLGEKRQALSSGTLDLPRLLESERLFCDLGRFTYLFHRITPEKYPIRFDSGTLSNRRLPDPFLLGCASSESDCAYLLRGSVRESLAHTQSRVRRIRIR
jgi:8-oxo-dGTP pyrophosphatase MutT (NUDIX family)